MSTISTLDNGVHVAQGRNQKTGSKDVATVNTKAAKDDEITSPGASRENIELSTRAQKIQKLSEEFFPTGPQSLKITPAFIGRLNEFGFLSDNEAKELSSSAIPEEDGPTPNLEELSVFVDRLSDQIKKEDPKGELVSLLEKSKYILDNLDSASSSFMAIDIKEVVSELTQYQSSEAVQRLSIDDRASLNQLEAALKIADKLNPENLSSRKVSHYLSVLNQSL